MYIKDLSVNSEGVESTQALEKESKIESSINSSWLLVPKMHEKRNNNGISKEEENRLDLFLKILSSPVVNIEDLRDLSWYGIPSSIRAICWGILLVKMLFKILQKGICSFGALAP